MRKYIMRDKVQLLAACERLLEVEKEVIRLESVHRDWFMSKPGHQDSFDIARALKVLLTENAARASTHSTILR